MKHVHEQMHRGRRPQIGADLGGRRTLVALDELWLTDIADAAIVSRLLDGILGLGAALVTTNSEPDDLYPGGLNRNLYSDAREDSSAPRDAAAGAAMGGDYRRKKAAASEEAAAASSARFFRLMDQRAAAALGAAVRNSAAREDGGRSGAAAGPPRAASLSSGGAACFSFEELCDAPRFCRLFGAPSRFHALRTGASAALAGRRSAEQRRSPLCHADRRLVRPAPPPAALLRRGTRRSVWLRARASTAGPRRPLFPPRWLDGDRSARRGRLLRDGPPPSSPEGSSERHRSRALRSPRSRRRTCTIWGGVVPPHASLRCCSVRATRPPAWSGRILAN